VVIALAFLAMGILWQNRTADLFEIPVSEKPVKKDEIETSVRKRGIPH
jgi:hypothetical protein